MKDIDIIIQPIPLSLLVVNLTGQVIWKIEPLKVKHYFRNAKRVGLTTFGQQRYLSFGSFFRAVEDDLIVETSTWNQIHIIVRTPIFTIVKEAHWYIDM